MATGFKLKQHYSNWAQSQKTGCQHGSSSNNSMPAGFKLKQQGLSLNNRMSTGFKLKQQDVNRVQAKTMGCQQVLS